jgi:hypothetical protein
MHSNLNLLDSSILAMNHIKVYFQESSIHGLPYIVNRDLHITEKVLWAFALVISFVCCGLLIYEIGVKVQEDAMVTYTSDKAINVVDVSAFIYNEIPEALSISSFKDSIPCCHILS